MAFLISLLVLGLASCSTSSDAPSSARSTRIGADDVAHLATTTRPARGTWAIALHGGAGVIHKTIAPDIRDGYLASLRGALELGRDMLAAGRSAVDTAEAVVVRLEDDPRFNAGRGAVYTAGGKHELDACIMDGRGRRTGAVTGVTTVKNPIRLARAVMEQSRHVLFAADGAEKFADTIGVERVRNDYFDTERRYRQWRKKVGKEKGTVGAVVLDTQGNLAAATSTGGLTNKRYGRVGDSPIVGAGNYACNRSCAVSGTGTGEQFIRHTVARDIAALVEYRDMPLQEAARLVVHERLESGDGGVIAVSRRGEIALVFNSLGMFRGAANSAGRFDVRIWE